MATPVIKNVQTQAVGFAPILRRYFDQCGIKSIIDGHVELDPRRKILTHGEAAVAMIVGILFQAMQLYRISKFASEKNILNVMLPHIAPEEYFDDRLADTLDAIFKSGIGNLELVLTRNIIDVFQIECDVCHNDTTSTSFYGDAANNKTNRSIRISFGHSKKHRDDLKQLVWSMSVSSDHAFPLFQQAYSGNTADVTTYVEQWNRLIDLLGTNDFLFVGDSKVITHENMAYIIDNEGFFIAPAPMYESYKNTYEQALENHEMEELIPYKDRINRGFEVPMDFSWGEKDYPLRMIILFDHGLCAYKQKALSQRIQKTREELESLTGKLNRYKLKTHEQIDAACSAILKKYKTESFVNCTLSNSPVTTYKNAKPGKPQKNSEKIAVNKDHYSVHYTIDNHAVDHAMNRCGYYPLLTNKPSELLTIKEAMMAHKKQYKCEHTFRRAKGPFSIEPIYLHTPERIQAYLFLFKIALQILVLIERTARKNIDNRDKGLDGFMPNKKDVRNPKSEFMLKEFEDIVIGRLKLPDGNVYGFVSDLNDLQKDILAILDVPINYYQYAYLTDSS